MNIPAHLFISDTGALFDVRAADWSAGPDLRSDYRRTFAAIDTVGQFKATLRAGEYAWPGGYPMYFITSDGAALSFASARAEYRNVIDSIAHGHDDGWRIVGCQINYEDGEMVCDHSGEPIQSAY
jgi:hypothetical protein